MAYSYSFVLVNLVGQMQYVDSIGLDDKVSRLTTSSVLPVELRARHFARPFRHIGLPTLHRFPDGVD